MTTKILKNALIGAVTGAIGGPVMGGLFGFLVLSLTWFIQGLIEQWSSEEFAQILPWAAVFGLLVASLGASVGVIVGVVVGAFDRWFRFLVNAGSFGGVIGSVTGLLAAPALFGNGDELSTVVAAIATMTMTGVVSAILVKQLQRRLKKASQVGN